MVKRDLQFERISLDLVKKIADLFFHKHFYKFVVVGTISTIVNYGLFYILFNWLVWHYLVSSGTGYVAGVFVGFALNKYWTFESNSKTYSSDLLGYLVIYTISLFLGLGLLKLLVVFGLQVLLANIFTIGLTTVTNFLGTKFLVFKKY